MCAFVVSQKTSIRLVSDMKDYERLDYAFVRKKSPIVK
jgi:hypothetical protein